MFISFQYFFNTHILFQFTLIEIIPDTWCGKSKFTVVSMQNTEFILALLFINCIIFYANNCKHPLAPPCINTNRIVPPLSGKEIMVLHSQNFLHVNLSEGERGF